MRNILAGIVLLLALAFTSAGLVVNQHKKVVTGPTVTLNNHVFAVNIADTEAKRERGLSGSDDLGQDAGMLFVFDTADQYCFWMKDMKFPLDMVWLDSNQHVIYIERNVQPDSYPSSFCPDKPARYVVELNAGTSDNLHVRSGDQARIQLP